MFNFYMDAHMHFDLYKNREEVLKYIEKNKSYTIAMTNLPELYEKYKKIYKGYKYINFALGFHPELVSEYYGQIKLFLNLCNNARYIGEVGLDFSKADKKEKDRQISIFSQIVNSCNEENKIMSIHSRRAAKEVIELLKDYKGKAILHWYSGSYKELYSVIERGFYFSINQQMIRSEKGREIIKKIPVKQLLIESDAPFTVGLGKEYSITFNDEIYEKIAIMYGQSIDNVKKRIKFNFSELLKKR